MSRASERIGSVGSGGRSPNPASSSGSSCAAQFGFMAFHGGALERQTDRIASAAADAAGASLYVVAHPEPDPPHFPSTDVRPHHSPALQAFLAHVQVVVTVHGFGRDGMFTTLLLGGSNRTLAATLRTELAGALPDYEIIDDLDAIPPPAAWPASGQPGQPAAARWGAGRAAAARARPRAALGGLDGRRVRAAGGRARRDARACRAILEAVTLRRFGAIAVLCVLAGCSSSDDDTLQPLPIEGATAAPGPTPFVTVGPPATVTTTTQPSTTVTTVAAVTSAAVDADGDWDGARFDLGAISPPTSVGAMDTVTLDRWSYAAPDGRLLDALTFETEPVVAWWHDSPFVNVNPRPRTFVLAPDVQVQLVDQADRATACAVPPSAEPFTATWKQATVADLSDPANTGTVAIITYGETGQISRIRLTRGC